MDDPSDEEVVVDEPSGLALELLDEPEDCPSAVVLLTLDEALAVPSLGSVEVDVAEAVESPRASVSVLVVEVVVWPASGPTTFVDVFSTFVAESMGPSFLDTVVVSRVPVNGLSSVLFEALSTSPLGSMVIVWLIC